MTGHHHCLSIPMKWNRTREATASSGDGANKVQIEFLIRQLVFCHLSTHSTSFSFDVFPSIKEEEETLIRRLFLPSFCCLSYTSSIIREKNRKGKNVEA